MKKYKVYLLTFPNGKKYCGYTSQKLERRWNSGHGYEKCPLVYRAIQKYGWENVTKELLYDFDNSAEALQKEKEVIAELNLTNTEYGYNLHQGGVPTGASDFLSEEGRKKISESNKAHWQDPEFRAYMVEQHKKHPPTRLCIERGVKAAAELKRGKIALNARPVIRLDLETLEELEEYPSASHAAIALTGKVDGCSNILKVCKKQRPYAYKYKWKFKDEEIASTGSK